MLQDIHQLRRMINEHSILELQQNKLGRNVLMLREANQTNGVDYSFELLDVPTGSIAIKSDKFHAPTEFFKRKKGQTKRSDYIVFTNFKSQNWIIFIELKKRKGGRDQIVQQLKGSKCLLDYCGSLGRNFWNQNDFLDFRNYKLLFVSFSRISLNKSPSLPPRSRRNVHDSPENMLTIRGGDQLIFTKLLRY